MTGANTQRKIISEIGAMSARVMEMITTLMNKENGCLLAMDVRLVGGTMMSKPRIYGIKKPIPKINDRKKGKKPWEK